MTVRETLVVYVPTKTGTIRETKTPSRGGVRVLVDGERIVVQWYAHGARRVESFPDTQACRLEAKAFAQGVAETLGKGPRPATPERLTLRHIWERYHTAEFPHLRAKTQRNYTAHWRKWELFLGKDFVAEDARLEHLEQLRADLTKQGFAIGQIHKIVTDVKMVHAWAQRRELLVGNRLSLYRFKVAKDARPVSPGEYADAEREALIATLDPQRAEHWRPWVAMMIANSQGARMNAILHLQRDDFDLETGEVVWRARWDKNGREHAQPLTYGAYSALLTAAWWRRRDGYAGPWVLYSSHARKQAFADERAVYHPTSLERALVEAEKRAGVVHQPYRGMHAFRRGIAGDILEATGDYRLALEWIDDTDLRMARTYLKRRNTRLDLAAAAIDDPKSSPNRQELVGAGANSLSDILGREDSNLQPRASHPTEPPVDMADSATTDHGNPADRSPEIGKPDPRNRHQPVTPVDGVDHA